MSLIEVLLTPLGWLLRGKKAGEESAYKHYPQLQTRNLFELSSPAFKNEGKIPRKHAGLGRGENISPELRWTILPKGTKQLLLVMEDIDVPLKKPILHMVVLFGPAFERMPEGALTPDNTEITFLPGRKGRVGYHGPRALPGHGIHRYWFHLYALDEWIPINDNYRNFEQLLPRVNGHVIGSGHLEGVSAFYPFALGKK
ncbi:MAG: YbhB/YbcL family Raf kinase inhibitor-like protein [Lacrimispora sp.]